jgi:hypothetical protein
LPDGLFSNQKYQFGYILDGLGMANIGTFCGHLLYFVATCDILWSFGTFVVIWYICGHLVHFVVIWYIFPVLVFCTKKNLATPVDYFITK